MQTETATEVLPLNRDAGEPDFTSADYSPEFDVRYDGVSRPNGYNFLLCGYVAVGSIVIFRAVSWHRSKLAAAGLRRAAKTPHVVLEYPPAITTAAQVKVLTGADQVTVSKGKFTARFGFFYTGGRTAADMVARVRKAIPAALVTESGEKWLPFNGGAPVSRQSHWHVTFTIVRPEA